MSRDVNLRLADMREACDQILAFVARGGPDWASDPLFENAVVRCLEVLGEAAKHVPDEVRAQFPAIPWPRICGLRDILIHRYFGVDPALLRSIVDDYVSELRRALGA